MKNREGAQAQMLEPPPGTHTSTGGCVHGLLKSHAPMSGGMGYHPESVDNSLAP